MTDTSLAKKQPKLVCVGSGRDGTVSLCRMVQYVFDRTDGRRAMHEYGARKLYRAFCAYKETGDQRFAEDIRRHIADCPYDCIVGNGYAAILPVIRDVWGPETRLVHIKRRDRDACIASLVKNCDMFPEAYGYYTSSEQATFNRMTAFHFGEMTESEWNRMPIAAKLGWYYDKTHALIEEYKGLFAVSVDLFTEDLSDDQSRQTIARLAGGADADLPPPTHTNIQEFDIASVPEKNRDKAIWLIGQLNWDLLFTDDLYALNHFLNSFIAWTGYQISGAEQLSRSIPPDAAQTSETLAHARELLTAAIKDIGALEKLNEERRRPAAE